MISRTKTRAIIGGLALFAGFASAQTVQVTVDGNPINFQDAQPQMQNGRVLVPLRGVFEAIGATVLWDSSAQSIAADAGPRHVRLRIGDHEANVDGHVVEMDTAPMISGGSTLVPLRFLSQSLGARVDWQPDQNLVAISSRRDRVPPSNFTPSPRPPVNHGGPGWDHPSQSQIVFPRHSVLPLWLDQTLRSDRNQRGDGITATVRYDRDSYLQLPRGTKVVGVVRRAIPAGDGHQGELEVRFTNLVLPNGRQYPIYGFVTQLNDPNIVKTGDGRFMAQSNSDVDNNIGKDAAIGAGAGLVLGSLHARAIGGAAVGGILGAIVGAFTSPRHDNNVQIERGTRLGLILGRDLVVDSRDMR